MVRTSMALFGGYGFTRGFRSADDLYSERRPRLLLEKVSAGLLNGALYSLPGVNLYFVYSMLNRFQICTQGLDKTKYKLYFAESMGFCYDCF